MNDPNEKIIEGNISPPKNKVRKKKVVEEEVIEEEKEVEFNNLIIPSNKNQFDGTSNMKKTIIITSIISLILGAVIAISAYFVYIVIKMQNQVNQNTTNIAQIVDFLNKNTQAPETTSAKSK